MDFEFTEEQIDIKKAARESAEKEFPNISAECDLKEEFPFELWKKASNLGMIGVFIPEAYGGMGLGYTEHCIINEEFWRVDPGLGMCLGSPTMGAEVIIHFGNENQKKTYLPPLVRGEALMGFAITEPDAGSDTFSVKTAAIKTRGGYVINGNKTFITNGSIGQFLVVYCLTAPENEDRQKRFSILIVETDRKGYEANKIKNKLGVRASDTAEIAFQDLYVPHENLIGIEGEGFHYLVGLLNWSRILAAVGGVGLAQGAMEKAITHVKSRKQFGRALIEFQAVRMKLAEIGTMVEAARNLVYKAASFLDKGKIDPGLSAMAKWFAGKVAVLTVDEALQVHGGYGYTADYDISRFYRDAKIVEIFEGTKEIMKEVVARSLLKKNF